MSVESYINWSQMSHAQFAAMALRDQIIFFALAVAITVLALTLTYWVVKGSLYLTYYAVKLSIYVSYYSVVLSLLFPYLIIKLLVSPNKSRPIQQKISVSQSAHVSINESNRFCSQCGKVFTSTMEETIHNKGSCFCESCGVKAEIRA